MRARTAPSLVARLLRGFCVLILCAACASEPPRGCPAPGTEVAVSLFGSTEGRGTLRFDGRPLSAVLRLSPTRSEGAKLGELQLAGPCTCEDGVIRARLSGTSDPSGARVLGAVIEGLYQPRLVAFEIIAAWKADYSDPAGQQGTMTGYLAGISPEDLKRDPH